MPIFDKSRRYVNKAGHTFGKGVWVDDDGTLIKTGFGYKVNRDSRSITQLNSDGTITKYPYEDWARKKASETELKVLINDRKHAIPVQHDRMITLTIDKNSPTSRNRGVTFSENLLDSIAADAKREGLPFSTAAGLVSTESTFGKDSRGADHTILPWLRLLNTKDNPYYKEASDVSYKGYYSPALLVSNWKQRNETPFHNYFYDEQGYLLTEPKTSSFYDEDINSARRKGNKYALEDVSPMRHAFRVYKKDPYSYNPNDPKYPDKVAANTRELTEYSPEIKEYMKRNNLKSEGGSLQKKSWDDLSMAEKSEMIGVAIRNGIINLSDIKQKYNEFAEGGSEREEVEVTTFPSNSDIAMTAMMKSKLATAAHYGNPTARRMTNYDGRDYTWPNEYEYAEGIGEPRKGNVFVSSYDNLVTPQIQDNEYSLEFVDDVWSPENDRRSYMQSIKFDTPQEAQYFGEHYKEIAPMMNLYNDGGHKIHIKPENRGKFTALKERTGHSATWFKEHGTPAQKKMATFALNARHWKHGFGGNLFEGGGRKLEYHPEGDYYYGGIPFKVTVTGKNKKKRPYWVSPKGAGNTALTIGDLSNAYTAATVGLLPNPISASINLSQGKVLNALEDMWLYNSAHSEDPNVNYGVVGFSAPEGSLFSSISKAAKATPKQWTAAQDAAIARGDMAEAQRLRDLHFKISAPNSTIVNEIGDPTHNYHGTTSTFTAFDPQKVGTTTGDKSGFFFTDNKAVANFYSHETGSAWNNLKLMLGLYKGHKPQIYDVYLNTTKPMITDFHGGVDEVGREILAKEAIKNGNDANILQNIIDGPPALPHNVTIMRNPKHIKSADAVTYDNNGVRIPLGKRDNFNINDIRYGLLPFGIGLTGYGLLNNQEVFGGRIKKRKR